MSKRAENHAVDYEYVQEQAQTLSFVQKYKKPILFTLVGGLGIVLGYFSFQKFILEPKEAKGIETIAEIQNIFDQAVRMPIVDTQAFQLVINGNNQIKGAANIAKNEGGKIGNLAKYYAGISYLKIGNFNEAVNMLKGFSTDVPQVQMMAYGALADAYSELQKNEDAITYYKKAAATFETDATSASEYLFRAALLSEVIGKNKEAIELIKELKNKFPQTSHGAAEADKYLNKLSTQENDFSVK